MPIYHELDQRSKNWYLVRLGIPTASEFKRIVTPTGKLSAQAADYAHYLLAEAMLARPLDSVETQWMVRGTELEASAMASYEMIVDAKTIPCGFVTNDAKTYGCSPDRLVGEDGGLELKCPSPQVHMGYLLNPKSMCQDKRPQVQGQLLVTGRAWWDLASFHPEMPPVIERVEPDAEYIAKLSEALDSFTELLATLRRDLEAKYGPFPAIEFEADQEMGSEFYVTSEDLDALVQSGAFEFSG